MSEFAWTCEICGVTGEPIRPGMVAWISPVFGKYENVDRCIDRAACRSRVEAKGEPWPVDDDPVATGASGDVR